MIFDGVMRTWTTKLFWLFVSHRTQHDNDSMKHQKHSLRKLDERFFFAFTLEKNRIHLISDLMLSIGSLQEVQLWKLFQKTMFN